MSSIIQLQVLLIKEGIQLYLDTTENESLVHRARNVAVGRFMQKTDCDLFMFIDADISWEPEDVLKLGENELVNHIKSIGLYKTKAKNIMLLKLCGGKNLITFIDRNFF